MNSAPGRLAHHLPGLVDDDELGREVAPHGVPQEPERGELGDRAHLRVAEGGEADDEQPPVERERRPAGEQVGERPARPALEPMGERRPAGRAREPLDEVGEGRRLAVERRRVGADARRLVGRRAGRGRAPVARRA